VRLGTEVANVGPADPGWELQLVNGGSVTTAHVVIATGPDARPVLPNWPGMASFAGRRHAAAQSPRMSRRPEPTGRAKSACWQSPRR
jgi:cation diffusion facilitator CzcD-associated flavoprotein CzcO